MERLKPAAIVAVLFALAAIVTTSAQEAQQGFNPCAPGPNFLGSDWHEWACSEPSQSRLTLQVYETGTLRPSYTGQPLSRKWQTVLKRSVGNTTARQQPYILRTPTLPECDRPYIQRSSSVGIIDFECSTESAGRHELTIQLGAASEWQKLQYFITIRSDLPSRAVHERSLLPDVETGEQIRIVGQGTSYPEFHFEVINRSEKIVIHVSVRAIFQDNGGFKVGDECGQYGATWRFNTRILPGQSRWLAITREACLSRATQFGADLLDATYADRSRYRAPQ